MLNQDVRIGNMWTETLQVLYKTKTDWSDINNFVEFKMVKDTICYVELPELHLVEAWIGLLKLGFWKPMIALFMPF